MSKLKLPFKVTAANGKVCDSSGAFLVGELERLDQKMHDPLVAVSWPRDIDLREDATIADEVTSFTISQFASAGSLGAGNSIGNGKAWIGKNTNEVAGVGVDIAKYVQPLRLWGLELKYTIPEIESAARLNRRPVLSDHLEDGVVHLGLVAHGLSSFLNDRVLVRE